MRSRPQEASNVHKKLRMPTTCSVPFHIDSLSSASYASISASIQSFMNATVNLGLPSKSTAMLYWRLTTTAKPTTFVRCGCTYGQIGTHLVSVSCGCNLHMSTPFHESGRPWLLRHYGGITNEWSSTTITDLALTLPLTH